MSGLTERLWPPVVQSLVADGAISGLVTVADSAGFYVNQLVHIVSLTQASTSYKVKRVLSPTQFYVGDPSKSIDSRLDVSRFHVADGAQVIASEQRRPEIGWEYAVRHVYQEEPVIALRTIAVDEYGDPKKMQLSNPLIKKPFDNIEAAYPDPVTETYTYRQGGIGGTLVGIVTVVYTDATKNNLSNVGVVNY